MQRMVVLIAGLCFTHVQLSRSRWVLQHHTSTHPSATKAGGSHSSWPVAMLRERVGTSTNSTGAGIRSKARPRAGPGTELCTLMLPPSHGKSCCIMPCIIVCRTLVPEMYMLNYLSSQPVLVLFPGPRRATFISPRSYISCMQFCLLLITVSSEQANHICSCG